MKLPPWVCVRSRWHLGPPATLYCVFIIHVHTMEASRCEDIVDFYDKVLDICASCDSLCDRGKGAQDECKRKCPEFYKLLLGKRPTVAAIHSVDVVDVKGTASMGNNDTYTMEQSNEERNMLIMIVSIATISALLVGGLFLFFVNSCKRKRKRGAYSKRKLRSKQKQQPLENIELQEADRHSPKCFPSKEFSPGDDSHAKVSVIAYAITNHEKPDTSIQDTAVDIQLSPAEAVATAKDISKMQELELDLTENCQDVADRRTNASACNMNQNINNCNYTSENWKQGSNTDETIFKVSTDHVVALNFEQDFTMTGQQLSQSVCEDVDFYHLNCEEILESGGFQIYTRRNQVHHSFPMMHTTFKELENPKRSLQDQLTVAKQRCYLDSNQHEPSNVVDKDCTKRKLLQNDASIQILLGHPENRVMSEKNYDDKQTVAKQQCYLDSNQHEPSTVDDEDCTKRKLLQKDPSIQMLISHTDHRVVSENSDNEETVLIRKDPGNPESLISNGPDTYISISRFSSGELHIENNDNEP